MGRNIIKCWSTFVVLLGASGLTACTHVSNQNQVSSNVAAEVIRVTPESDLSEVVSTKYNPQKQTVDVYVRSRTERMPPNVQDTSENLIDVRQPDGIINLALAKYPNASVREVNLYAENTATPRLTIPVSSIISLGNSSQPVASLDGPATMAAGPEQGIHLPPQGISLDPGIRPTADIYDSITKKTQAVLDAAQSKIGTPYIWGHNEDRGQTGFDCSNFTAYVYHHALGYKMTTLAKGQFLYVGQPVPKSNMVPGDLLIFDRGGHVGIYVGQDRMIQEGGGLGKVGYGSVAPGSYWATHLSVVKRMY